MEKERTQEVAVCSKLFMRWIRQFRAFYTVLDTSQLPEYHISVTLTSFLHFYLAQIWLVLRCVVLHVGN